MTSFDRWRSDPHFFTPRYIRRYVPGGKPGTYALGALRNNEFAIGYVGRSDCCVRSRLLSHELLGEFDVFAIDIARDSVQAFTRECELWHRVLDLGGRLANRIHPAIPRGQDHHCPYCNFALGMRTYSDSIPTAGGLRRFRDRVG